MGFFASFKEVDVSGDVVKAVIQLAYRPTELAQGLFSREITFIEDIPLMFEFEADDFGAGVDRPEAELMNSAFCAVEFELAFLSFRGVVV